jgi:hypothetical protein
VQSYDQLLWGLASTLLAFVFGLAWRKLSQFVVNRRARRFWKPLVAHDVGIVIGRFTDSDGMEGFEASGVVGVGDHVALKSLTDHFRRIGFKRFTVRYTDDMALGQSSPSETLQGNLILLGGPDVNGITRAVLERMSLGVEFLIVRREHLDLARAGRPWDVPDPPARLRRAALVRRLAGARTREWRVPAFGDRARGTLHGPVFGPTKLFRDCAAIIRGRNPFNPDREVMLFCGSYGYGTWAAAQFATTPRFLDLAPAGGSLECVIGVDVVLQTPQRVTVELLRPLADDDRPPSGQVLVPRLVG